MSIVLNGEKIETPGLETVSYMDGLGIRKATDLSRRSLDIQAIVLHTTKGMRGKVLPGSIPSQRAEALASYQTKTDRDVSWDYTIDLDGTIVVSNDPLTHYTWHAGDVNPFTLGIEFVQTAEGDQTEYQISQGVKFLNFLTRELAKRGTFIQRQIPIGSDGSPRRGVISRIEDNDKARTVYGLYGHDNQTSNKGVGDPGSHIFNALLANGYKGFNLDAQEDIVFWSSVQQRLGGLKVDGKPGPNTCKALQRNGHPLGLWVSVNGD